MFSNRWPDQSLIFRKQRECETPCALCPCAQRGAAGCGQAGGAGWGRVWTPCPSPGAQGLQRPLHCTESDPRGEKSMVGGEGRGTGAGGTPARLLPGVPAHARPGRGPTFSQESSGPGRAAGWPGLCLLLLWAEAAVLRPPGPTLAHAGPASSWATVHLSYGGGF